MIIIVSIIIKCFILQFWNNCSFLNKLYKIFR